MIEYIRVKVNLVIPINNTIFIAVTVEAIAHAVEYLALF